LAWRERTNAIGPRLLGWLYVQVTVVGAGAGDGLPKKVHVPVYRKSASRAAVKLPDPARVNFIVIVEGMPFTVVPRFAVHVPTLIPPAVVACLATAEEGLMPKARTTTASRQP
jgi:hypothetical protein